MKVVICDDQSLFAQALAVVLRSHGDDVVACVTSPGEAESAVASGDIDVCVMDLHFPAASGVDGVSAVLATAPETKVVVLTGSTDSVELARAVDAGARGLAVKGDDIPRVVDTLHRVHEGEIVLKTPQLHMAARRVVEQPMDRNSLTRFLTNREREVLERLVRGESTADLARAMNVRYSTARTHIQSMLTKLGVHSKLEAVAYAVANGVVDVAGPTVARSA